MDNLQYYTKDNGRGSPVQFLKAVFIPTLKKGHVVRYSPTRFMV